MSGIRYHPLGPAVNATGHPVWKVTMAELKEPTEIITVAEPTVACDGGGGALGHPRVYLDLTAGGRIDCPYCGRRYILEAGAATGGHH